MVGIGICSGRTKAYQELNMNTSRGKFTQDYLLSNCLSIRQENKWKDNINCTYQGPTAIATRN